MTSESATEKPLPQPLPLAGRSIAIPESRQLDLFANMLESRGAAVLRCPLINILDAPDPAPIEKWLREFSEGSCNDLILLTGEGLRRLLGVAERAGGDLQDSFIKRLADVRTITRGPKPARALRDLGLRADLPASAPTTDGIIASLRAEDLHNRSVGVQLYGSDPNQKLIDFLNEAGATPKPVAPYVYADQTEDGQVVELIEQLASGQVDAIAFTSSPQVRRIFSVAKKREMEDPLRAALAKITVAAVGPIVAESLNKQDVAVNLMPDSSYFMKPLVRELVKTLAVC